MSATALIPHNKRGKKRGQGSFMDDAGNNEPWATTSPDPFVLAQADNVQGTSSSVENGRVVPQSDEATGKQPGISW